jgi:imidazoleglycerol-phosphate dehydratase
MTRTAQISRQTSETEIEVQLNLDGSGQVKLDIVDKMQQKIAVPFLQHMLEQLIKYSLFDISIVASGDVHIDDHHLVEDIAISLGQALSKAIGNKAGIARFGAAYAPLDEALSRVVVDYSGRGGLSYRVEFVRSIVGDFDTDLFREFFQAFVNHAGLTLHIDNLYGNNAHHQAESIFKAFGLAMRSACATDAARAQQIPSTKGVL